MKLLFVLCLVCFGSMAQASYPDSLFVELNEHIARRAEFSRTKNITVEKLSNAIPEAKETANTALLYFLCSELAKEYDAYNYDSAMKYTQRRIAVAYELNDIQKINYSLSETGNLLVKRGLYREGIDSLLHVYTGCLSQDMKVMHYGFLANAYYDIADYNKDQHFSPTYRILAEQYVDSIVLASAGTNYYTLWFEGLRYLARYDLDKALLYYNEALLLPRLTAYQKGHLHSALGYIYRQKGEPDKSIYHTIQAAIGDLKTSRKESMALTSLAEFLYGEGDLERAYTYILIAKEDAEMYGAKLRQLSISYLLPEIEAAKLDATEQKRKQMLQSVFVVSLISFLVAILAFVSFFQLVKLRKARKQILQSNVELKSLTNKLSEANKIKTEYIGYYFNFSSQYIDRLESVKKIIAGFLKAKNHDAIERTIKSLNTKAERARLFKNFDSYFLVIFPEFVAKFNALLTPETQYVVPEKELNADLRIFALIRLGIKDNETIAKILGFSVNTIYTYKTKIKKNALVSSAEFDRKLMEIRSV